ncbi:PssD/Cps14F family polysaccharide biosynthesis glycosyltransferase [Shouchella rhizosphaerae]|uniref:PssD/Cps14F family polysaccharide biosynthesis glycosyltransferase n=1 Tax=Shouchella rhizosphaerae TaxID=866786 RepID=A0ABZ2CWN9_9BACI
MSKRISLVSSTGGHWSQLLEVYKEIIGNEEIEDKNVKVITEKNDVNNTTNYYYLIQQDRKNRWFLLILLMNFFKSVVYVIKFRPHYVISTGAGVVLPFLISAKIFGAKIIFIESFAKVNSPTLTGRIVYRFADYFFVQWEEMLVHYPKAIFKGSLY